MAFKKMSKLDQKVIGECLQALPLFVSEDLSTVTGVEENRLLEIIKTFPNVSDSNEDVDLAIHGALTNVVGYPHGMHKKWGTFISVSAEELSLIHARWRALKDAEK
ncbi:hypothetical protein [Deinococcus ruber]|uniref:Uncharacterized protein n=1 Tax=Deinococcus ruber TaxID=1848197 RepID=A0A918CHU1_9DEIO|nr:hypothetical protein [Deinococcus ruber]GGR24549.1 hypothetical protein GCM10008957_40300 [Deinococcus ruber]